MSTRIFIIGCGAARTAGCVKNFHQFSGWTATLYDCWLIGGNREFLVSYLDPLLLDYGAWESERLLPGGLFWQRDVADGMESSISGGRHVKNVRPSINSYMYGNAKAIAAIAALAGRNEQAQEYRGKAARLKHLVQKRLWNREAAFFETLLETGKFAGVREEIGFTPWYFDLPDAGAGLRERLEAVDGPQEFLRTVQPGYGRAASRRISNFKRGETSASGTVPPGLSLPQSR